MKMLIYGIDGGDLEIMKTFDMPFVHKFLDENTNIELTEDLFNRGWTEILTGKEGKDTHGFYMAPLLDGSHRCATKFSMKQLENDPDIVPLWKLAEQKGVKYCIMNVPTTTPVPQTKNGIVIGSAGGGLNKIEGIPEILVSDEKTRKYLEEKNYIVDIRIPNQNIAETEELFRQLKKMEDVRTDCFIEICQKENIEFGFLANRGTTIAEYLARSEIESYAALKEMDEFMTSGGDKSWVHKHLEEHFASLDNSIRRLYEELKPDHFIITADHNMVPHKYRANMNAFLIKHGFLKYKSSSNVLKRIKKLAKKILSGHSIGMVTAKLPPSARESLKPYDWKKSVAFGHNFVCGIYMNDMKRFGGCVKEGDQLDAMVDNVVDTFNKEEVALERGLSAKPYRRDMKDAKFYDYLPDIVIEGCEGMFFDDEGTEIIRRNKNYGPITHDLSLVTHAAHSGDKGLHPIFLITSDTSAYIEESDKRNLTLVYKIVERVLDDKPTEVKTS